MKIAIVGSTEYKELMAIHQKDLQKKGHKVSLPAFDDHKDWDELQVCEYNRSLIEQADMVHIFWNQRSMGTIFDFGMAFALRKPVEVVLIQTKTFANVMWKYEALTPPSI